MKLNEIALGQKIKKIRLKRNFKQAYLAHELSISTRAYSKIETSETKLTVRRLYQIADVLEASILEILLLDEKDIIGLRIAPEKGLSRPISNAALQELQTLLQKMLEQGKGN
jgi:transcriptional regulator with XRE-family HTH domain